MSDDRNLVDRVVVEPLDDERWTAIERGVIGALRTASIERALADARPARRWVWPVLGGALAAAAAVGVILARRAPDRAIDPTGDPAGAPALAIATDATGTRIDLGRAVLTVAPDTAFALARPGGGVDVALDHGAIELAVAHREDLPPVVVHAGDVDVIDVGTVFTVERRADGAVSVSVREGEVRIERAGTSTRVVAGQRWAGGELVAIDSDRGATTGPIAQTGAVAIPIGGPNDLLSRRHVAAPPRGAAAPHGHADGHAARSGAAAGIAPPAAADPIADLRAAIAAQPIPAASDVGTTDPTAALERYRRLATDDKGAQASGGLYGMARVQSLALGQSAEALRTLGAYVKRFPDGAELEAVLWLRLRILCRGGIDDACRAAAHTYLGRFPDSDRAGLVERITVARQ
ncbi:MAG: FecR family protein [Deltaproteobacteria bacterium]|nr:FecR family protein [Deltaproteobacteria bacterium]